jgi:RNA polymerase sigma-70 factor (ECF subfamily)
VTHAGHSELSAGVILIGAAFPAERRISLGQIPPMTVTLRTSQPSHQWHNALMDPEIPDSATRDFEALTRQHKDSVYRQMIRTCGNREDAEDVLIEALLKAYRHLDQLRDSAAFRAWLTRIAKRVCWQLKEREALLPLLQLSTLDDEGREVPSDEPTPELILARRQMKQFLDDAVSALPAQYQSVYKMRDIEDRPGSEVARTLGISTAAMKSRLHRAREMVRLYLDAVLTRAGSTQ